MGRARLLVLAVVALLGVGACMPPPAAGSGPKGEVVLLRAGSGRELSFRNPEGMYVIDTGLKRCFFAIGEGVTAIDCAELAAGVPTAARHMPWLGPRPEPARPEPPVPSGPDEPAGTGPEAPPASAPSE